MSDEKGSELDSKKTNIYPVPGKITKWRGQTREQKTT